MTTENRKIGVVEYDYRDIVVPDTSTKLEELATQYARADDVASKMAEIKKVLKPLIIAENLKQNGFIAKSDIKTLFVGGDGKPIIVQVINAVLRGVDAGLAKEILTAEQWALVEKVEVNTKKFFDAIELGVIKPMLIAPAITTEPSTKIYVR